MDPSLQREVQELRVAAYVHRDPAMLMRAVRWRNTLRSFGSRAPFWLIHDLGLAFLIGEDGLPPSSADPYIELLRQVGQTELARSLQETSADDTLVSVLIDRAFAPIQESHVGAVPVPSHLDMPFDHGVLTRAIGTGRDRRSADLPFLAHLLGEQIRLLLALEQVDLDTLKIVSMFGGALPNAFSALDFVQVLSTPEAHDVVNFSMDLIPSVLETARAKGQQSYGMDGYAGIAREGSLDSLMLSELAHEDLLFDLRYAEQELFYFTHDKHQEEESHRFYIAIDASASMRGQRATFARGLALTLIKKILVQGEEVYVRFFDAHLYERMHANPRQSSFDVASFLGFRGEHGRNYPKVFALLANDLETQRRAKPGGLTLYLITHAECHVPRATIERLRAQARLYGIFILPSSGELAIDYGDLLDRIQVVDGSALQAPEQGRARAKAIVDDATDEDRWKQLDPLSPETWAAYHGLAEVPK